MSSSSSAVSEEEQVREGDRSASSVAGSQSQLGGSVGGASRLVSSCRVRLARRDRPD